MVNEISQGIENMETEIVIVGAGGAGLAAAVTAAERGAKVILLEKRSYSGGNSAMAEGLFGAESPLQKRTGIEAGRDYLFNKAIDYAHWKINPLIVRAFVDKSGDTIEWLENKGLKFYLDPLYPNQVPLVFHCLKKGGAAVVDVLIKNCEESGVLVLCETAAKHILKDNDGNIAGILAVRKGEYLRITAKSVIIASGGYGGNQELLKKYCNSYAEDMLLRGIPNMGDGLAMATEFGAATDGLGILQLSGPIFRGSSLVGSIAREPFTIWINKKGERFTNEAITFFSPESANAIERQPDKISYTLFDEEIKKTMLNNRAFVKRSRITSFTADDLESELKNEADRGMIKISGSWGEIAEFVGVAPEVLEEIVNDYNSCCELGHDKVFTKDPKFLTALHNPPYYAVKCCLGFLGTIGGIKINHNMEVLNHQDNPIPGLYAAGIDTGGWESYTYCSLLSGSTFGFAINSGRIAAENASDCIRGLTGGAIC
jgi:fumarate reductase flavoprotein subunit